jgi:hypothetical protein
MLLVAARQTPACLLNTSLARVRSTFTTLSSSRYTLLKSKPNCSGRSLVSSTTPDSNKIDHTIMGRWRGNKKRIWKQKDGSSSTKDADVSNKNVIWSWKQEKEVIAYLTAYRQAAERVYQQDYGNVNGHSNGDSGSKRHANTTDDADKAPVVIGGIVFPALTDSAVSQAYMTLSAALSSKQRKAMHEFSVDGTLHNE